MSIKNTHFIKRLKHIESNQKIESLDSLSEKAWGCIAHKKNTQEGLWRIDFTPSISLFLPKQTQISSVFQNGVWAEANDLIAKQYGLVNKDELIGKKINLFFPASDSKNQKSITELVKANFYSKDIVSYERDLKGHLKVFLNNIVPSIKDSKVLCVWGTSIEITELDQIRQQLKITEKKLIERNRELSKKNIALKEIISHIEIEKQELKKRLKANIEKVLLPSLDKISVNLDEKILVEQHRNAIENLASSFGIIISDENLKLTPREIEVCSMVKNGLTNKEMAKALHVSIHTVEKHRRMARKKLGLTSKGINLRTYLNNCL